MADYKNTNKQVLRRAFSRFHNDIDAVIKQGMIEAARAGLQYLVDYHNAHRGGMSHVEETDTMAYVVANEGRIIEAKAYDGGNDDLPGRATEMAKELAAATKGWAIFILSDMESWYRYDYEVGFLIASANDIKRNFQKFFKPVK